MLAAKDICTGCGACREICPTNCIIMKKDESGFFYPEIENNSCIACKNCEDVCPVLKDAKVSLNTISLAAKNKTIEDRLGSSSGGIFCTLSNFIIDHNGHVCAAIYTDDFTVEHAITSSKIQTLNMRGAKYVQSNAWQCFSDLKVHLDNDEWVMFVGTPCQVAGFKSFLNKDYEKLILVDMVCHGVPSDKVWKKYLAQRNLIDSSNGELVKINLRNKTSGWSRYSYSVEFQYSDGNVYCELQNQDWYLRGFVQNLFLRKSCSACKFKGIHRMSDFTLGDYWGIWNQHPEFDDNLGTSLLFIHSDKAKDIWKEIEKEFDYIEVDKNDAIIENMSVINSSVPHKNREQFFEQLDRTEKVIELIKENLNQEIKNKESFLSKICRSLFRMERQL